MKKISIIGCGAIGSEIARAIDNGVIEAVLDSLYDIRVEKCIELTRELNKEKPVICENIDCITSRKPDIVVEAASQEAVKQYLLKLLENGFEVIVLSVGALLDQDLREKIREVAGRTRGRVYVPSGAVCGLDAVRALSITGFSRVKLTTRKHPRSVDRKSLLNLGVDPDKIERETTVFRGSAEDAVKKLPFNINVAATLKLASSADVEVEFIVDPSVDKNIHEILLESPASRVRIVVENNPHPFNPKTSYLAALSAIALIKRLTSECILVGT